MRTAIYYNRDYVDPKVTNITAHIGKRTVLLWLLSLASSGRQPVSIVDRRNLVGVIDRALPCDIDGGPMIHRSANKPARGSRWRRPRIRPASSGQISIIRLKTRRTVHVPLPLLVYVYIQETTSSGFVDLSGLTQSNFRNSRVENMSDQSTSSEAEVSGIPPPLVFLPDSKDAASNAAPSCDSQQTVVTVQPPHLSTFDDQPAPIGEVRDHKCRRIYLSNHVLKSSRCEFSYDSI